MAVRVRVAVCERRLTDAAKLNVGGIGAVGEVRVAVAKLLRQVERTPLRDLPGAKCRIAWKPLEHLGRRRKNVLVVRAAFLLAAVE